MIKKIILTILLLIITVIFSHGQTGKPCTFDLDCDMGYRCVPDHWTSGLGKKVCVPKGD